MRLVVFGLILFILAAPAEAVVYLTVEEALREAFPEAQRFKAEIWTPTAQQRQQLEKALGRPIPEPSFTFHHAQKGKTLLGDAIVLDEIGKHQPITFLFAIHPDGTIKDIVVLVFRESRGSEVRQRRFLKQYFGKKKTDVFRIGKEIDGVTGATLSCRAASVGARKSLLLREMFYQRKEFE